MHIGDVKGRHRHTILWNDYDGKEDGLKGIVGYSIADRKASSVKFIHYCKTEDALLHCKRACFALQKGIFYHAKGRLLQRKRAPFTTCFVIIR